MGTLSNNSKVGDKGKDLILQTSGRVYVQVKDRFYEINFRGDDEEDKDEEKEETPQIIFVEDPSILDDSYPYPGDNYLIIAGGEFFRTIDGEYQPIQISTQQNSTFNIPITINTLESPFNISSTVLVKNLNAEYLNGVPSIKFGRKDRNETIEEWTIKTLNGNLIKDSANTTYLNLKDGILDINTIRVKNLFAEISTPSDSEEGTAENDFKILNKKTYISDGLKVNKVSAIDKLTSFIIADNSTEDTEATKTVEYYSNENYLVGGYSIVDLIVAAFKNERITEFDEIHEYVNKLTICEKLDSNLVWQPYSTIEEDFEATDSGTYPYQTYRFTPVESSIYSTYAYGVSSTCLEGIYNKWYNIETYIGDIKDTYQGLSYEFEVVDNTINAGSLLIGKTNKGILKFLAVGSTPSTIRVIAEGTDCYFSNSTLIEDYKMWENNPPTEEPELTIYQNIKSCLESTNIPSPEVGDNLLTGSSQNIIGNISGTENSIFGTLEGYGLTSEGNCYFVNPGIALVNTDGLNYLNFYNKEQSFIGINKKNEKWITIETDGGCDMRRDKMYNINNHLSFCSFGPIRVEEDGSATIGSGETQITITADGRVQIPEACIIK